MESSSAKKDLAVLVASKVTVSQLRLTAAEEMSLTLGCMSRSTASPLLLLVLHVGLVALLSTAALHTQACCMFTQSSRCYSVRGNFLLVSSGAVSARCDTPQLIPGGNEERELCSRLCSLSLQIPFARAKFGHRALK